MTATPPNTSPGPRSSADAVIALADRHPSVIREMALMIGRRLRAAHDSDSLTVSVRGRLARALAGDYPSGTMALVIDERVRYPRAAPDLVARESSPMGPRPPKLLDRVREAIRLRHGSRSTETSYVGWIRRYILFHGKPHPLEMGAPEVTSFLSALAIQGKVAASTQNQALNALLFLHRHVLQQDLPWLDDVVRAKRPRRLPTVLTRDEVRAVISELPGTPRLMATLLYGSGLRLLECARLRVKDIDFATNQVVVRCGKGGKDRVTVLPAVVKAALAGHLERVKGQHDADLARGAGWVELPWALARKYPNAGREWPWQWVFPATRVDVERQTGQRRRHHLTRRWCSAPSPRPFAGCASPSGPPVTPSATPSRRISSKMAATSAPSKRCWATMTSARR
jgi:integron integrase